MEFDLPDYMRGFVFHSQLAGMYGIRDWSSIKEFYKHIALLASVSSGDTATYNMYTVPADHKLFVTDVLQYIKIAGGSLGNADVYAFIYNSTTGSAIHFAFYTDAVRSTAYGFTLPQLVDESETITIELRNLSSLSSITFESYVLGYELSEKTHTKIYEVYEDEILEHGLWNYVKFDLTGAIPIVIIKNALSRSMIKVPLLIKKNKLIPIRQKRHKIKWFTGYGRR